MLPNKILLIDDSQFFLEVFKFELLKHLNIQIDLATTADVGFEKLSMSGYDLLLMDVMMPGTDGVSAAHKFHQRYPTLPIVLMSAAEPKALERMGYPVEALDKFTFIGKPKSKDEMKAIAEKVKSGAFWSGRRSIEALSVPPKVSISSSAHRVPARIKMIGIVVSTGGPNTLLTVLQQLPSNFPIPILIVQHMSVGFLDSFVRWLAEKIDMPVGIVDKSQPYAPGVWIAPEGAHLLVRKGRMIVDDIHPAYKLFRPSGNLLLKSIASEFRTHAIGMVLTGLGADGAEGMEQISANGGYTIVQEPKSCMISGMVNATLKETPVNQILTPKDIAELLVDLSAKSDWKI